MSYNLSIITVCYNSEIHIQDCVNSVLKNAKSYTDFEYIVVDGASQDGTVALLNSYRSQFEELKIPFTILSEQDKGLYDAMNKGILACQGKWVWFLNSDDYLEDNAFYEVFNSCSQDHSKYEGIYGKLTKVGEEVSYQVGKRRLGNRDKNVTFNHPSTLILKNCFLIYGNFKLKYQMCADYELFTNFVSNGIQFCFLDKNLTFMREGGVSDKLSSYLTRGREHFYIDFHYYGFFIAIKNSLEFFGIGLVKKIFKEGLLFIHNKRLINAYYQKKYGESKLK